MISKQDLLSEVRIASPCPARWNEMEGDDRTRFCWECRRSVYNLSDMTRAEAEAFVQEATGRVCVRFYQRPDGTMLTRDCPVGREAVLRALRRRLATTLSGGCVAILSLWAWATRQPAPTAEELPIPIRRTVERIAPPDLRDIAGGLRPIPIMGKPAPPVVMGEMPDRYTTGIMVPLERGASRR